MNIGKSIKIACAITGSTQIQLAAHMQVTEQTITNWVKGNTHPTTDKLASASLFFGMPVSEFIKNGESK